MNVFTDFIARKDGKTSTDLAILAILAIGAFFQNLGKLPLIETDEARYMEIPREMIERATLLHRLLTM